MSRPMAASPTPSLAGYVGVWSWSVLFCAGILGAFVALDDGNAGGLVFMVIALPYAAVGSLPAAPLGLLLLHGLCRHVHAQWVHVVVATGVGALCGLAYGAVFDGAWGMVPLLAASVGLARWAVVPHVPSYRLRHARRRAVDDDFAGARPRW